VAHTQSQRGGRGHLQDSVTHRNRPVNSPLTSTALSGIAPPASVRCRLQVGLQTYEGTEYPFVYSVT
jgi:hypothetical protein